MKVTPTELTRRTAIRISWLVGILALLAALTYLIREPAYEWVVQRVGESGMSRVLAAFFSESGLILLVLGTGVLAVVSWFTRREIFWRFVSAGIGVVLAFGLSTVIKLLATEQRPCQLFEVQTVNACPPMGDWSWPSNHSVIAAAFACACALAVRKLRWYVSGLALLIALARVGVGAHYLHDVLSGLALGTAVVALCVFLFAQRLDAWAGHKRVTSLRA